MLKTKLIKTSIKNNMGGILNTHIYKNHCPFKRFNYAVKVFLLKYFTLQHSD